MSAVSFSELVMLLVDEFDWLFIDFGLPSESLIQAAHFSSSSLVFYFLL